MLSLGRVENAEMRYLIFVPDLSSRFVVRKSYSCTLNELMLQFAQCAWCSEGSSKSCYPWLESNKLSRSVSSVKHACAAYSEQDWSILMRRVRRKRA
jgi:hypothetical protein